MGSGWNARYARIYQIQSYEVKGAYDADKQGPVVAIVVHAGETNYPLLVPVVVVKVLINSLPQTKGVGNAGFLVRVLEDPKV